MKVTYNWDTEYPKPEYWDSRTTLYIGMPKFFTLYQNYNDRKLRCFLKKLNGQTLDVGCGDGRFMDYADVGVDFSRENLKRAKKNCEGRQFVRASALYLPFKPKVFHNVFTADVLSHIPPDKRRYTLNELDRVARASYNFLGEDRTVIVFILEQLKTIRSKFLWLIIPYTVVLFAFPIDRLRQLITSSPTDVLKKLDA